MPEHNTTLDELEFGCLKKLINTPSFSKEGEIQMGDLIEGLLQNSDSNISSISLGEGTPSRRVILAEKGELEANFCLMFLGHYDKVEPPNEWLNPSYERRAGKVFGNGAWDQLYGIQQMISLAHTANVPEGMKVRFAFVPDEEKNSKGILELMRRPEIQETDLVISAEIPGSMGETDPKDKYAPLLVPHREPGAPMRFVTKRRGVLKMNGAIWADGRGHAAAGGSNAITEFACAITLMRRYTKNYLKEHIAIHPLLGSDELQETGVMAPKSKYQNTKRRVEFDLNLHMVPTDEPRILEEMLHIYQSGFERIAQTRDWTKKGIQHELTMIKNDIDRSYLPYTQGNDHELFVPVRKAIKTICHPRDDAEEVPGYAWADQNLVVAAGHPCIEVFADGANCHDSNEWVLEEDIGKIREVFRYCIEEAFRPFLIK